MKSNIFTGTEIKLNVSIEPIGGLTMDEYDFKVDVFCSNSKVVSVKKDDAIRVDEKNYIVLVDTNIVGQGRLRCKITAELPDDDFADGYRTEIAIIDTGIDIIKSLR